MTSQQPYIMFNKRFYHVNDHEDDDDDDGDEHDDYEEEEKDKQLNMIMC